MRKLLPLIVALGGLLAWPAGAQEMPVPPKLQAALFQKIFAYDKTLGGAAAAKVLVVYPDAAPGPRDELVRSFTELGVSVTSAKLSGLAGAIGGSNVVYLLGGAGTEAAKEMCAQHKVLAVSGVPAYADSGTVAVALDTVDDRPKILVNMAALHASEHQLSPDLLRLARVIQ